MTSINNFSNKSPKSEKTVSHRICSKSNTTGATGGVGTAYPPGALAFIPGFGGVRVARSLIFCIMFCRWLFVLLSFFFWPLCCLFFFNLRLLHDCSFGFLKLVLLLFDFEQLNFDIRLCKSCYTVLLFISERIGIMCSS